MAQARARAWAGIVGIHVRNLHAHPPAKTPATSRAPPLSVTTTRAPAVSARGAPAVDVQRNLPHGNHRVDDDEERQEEVAPVEEHRPVLLVMLAPHARAGA